MKKILTLLFLSVTTLSYAQQLKLGSNPSVIRKSALLELESGSQGLLLPRISDTTSATIKSSPDGMLIYLTLNNSLSVRSLGKWQSLGSGSSSLTLTGDVTGTGTGTVASTISNQAVTFAKMQNINTQRLLGRYTAGAGSTQEVSLDNSLKLNTGGTLYADSALSIWNASKLIGMRVSGKAPLSGEVLKWNGTAWESNTDNDGGATYGTLTTNDVGNADVAGSTTRMKIWASPVTGVVTNGPAGTGAHAWSVMAFKGNNGGFTTQLYFDKNTLALKEWTGITAPLGTNAINGWYKAIMTNGNTNISNGSIIFGNITSDASTEVGQDNANLFWNNTGKRLGVKTNTPTSTVDINGSFSMPIRGAGSNTTLTENDYTVVKNTGADITITLPAANSCSGRIYVIKKASSGILVINSGGGQIDANGTSVTLTSGQRVSYTIQSDGGNWWIIAGI
ncbi:hypothetical protein L3C95_25150 [Chitinophaga filiformis]|uniref:hypothetical protein n=1 Tax=Chitinophaga filiformis TaxID=104663 RepID=UPI001F317A27|nr:hypothetical protein [Chitinophaga filiformis]MCF6406208.1 hypothetical protein [Chitinophaga filiformis]